MAAAALLTPHTPALAGTGLILNINGDEVHIDRDSYGVPRITAETNHGLFAGFGYAVAQDRLWQLELNRRAGHGTLAEILGPGFVTSDRNTRTLGYTDAELDQMFATGSSEEQDQVAGYVDGVNLYLSQVVAPDPANKLPFEFQYLNIGAPAPFTTRDLIAFGVFTSRSSQEIGDQERTAQSLLSDLVKLHGPTDGLAIFNDVQWLFDPDSPASIPVDGANGKKPHPKPPAPPASQLQGAADSVESDPDVEESLEAIGVPTRVGSHAWVVGPQWSTNGSAMFFGGPQLALLTAPSVIPAQVPPQFLEVELDGGDGFHVRGITYPCLTRIIIGRNDHLAWSITSANTANNVDTYVETVCGGGTSYLYQGNCVPFDTRTEVIKVRGAAPQTLTVQRTVHGPVMATAPGVCFSRKSVERYRELENGSAFLDINRAQNVQQFDQAVHRLVGTLNFLCADNSGNIGFWRGGLTPIRPPGFDVRLPLPGDGSAEWVGVDSTVASSINPVRGWLTSWNNKATVDEEVAEKINFGGKQERVQDIEDRLRAGPLSLSDMQDIENDISRIGQDRNALGRPSRYLLPYLLQALDAVPPAHPLAAQARALVEAWDGNALQTR
jgi:penicillin amidase